MDSELRLRGAWWIIIGLVAAIGVTLAAVQMRPPKKIHTFEQCIKAGGARLESFPEQCSIRGKTFTNTHQQQPESGATYIGMSENEALARAEKERIPARVVERDGESLPVTYDFVSGRHNLHVKDGVVYKVDIEGQATE